MREEQPAAGTLLSFVCSLYASRLQLNDNNALPQSIDSCSPLLSLLLDAACKVDCLEREDNPNNRWNHRVERDLRRKLFALGYGIRVEDVDERNRVRSITGEKDYL